MKEKLFILLTVMLLLASSVIAADVCCEKLASSDDYCVYTDETECDSNYKDAAVSCEQTSFCKVGCCYSSDEGECYKNVASAECTSIEGTTWTDSASCEISQCQKGCCILGSQGFFVTEVRCKLETSKYGHVTMEWKSEITSEPECQAQARSQEMGCCVADSCTFTTRENCATAATTPTTNESGEGFYKDMLCSNDLLSCGCAKQTSTGCYDDKVYWFDSCGNRENVYSSDKTKSYNNGYVLSADNICDSPATLSPDCGNCDYGQGSICRAVNAIETNVKPKHGDYICSKTSCDSTYDDGVSPSAGGTKKNGESWCLYDSRVGQAQDLVGSRHYRRLCINGEEMVEPCMDYREEMCVQGVLGEGTTTTYTAFSATGDYVEAACRDNRWEDCFDCNSAEESCGSECSVEAQVTCNDCNDDQEDEVRQQANKLAVRLCCAQKCCKKEELRDCYFMGQEKGKKLIVRATNGQITSVENIGYCAPQVPPGLQFWPTGTEEFPTSTTRGSAATTAAVTTGAGVHGKSSGPSSNAESVCSQANQECTVTWKIGGTGRLGIGGLGTQDDYECISNCHCTEKEWVIGGNTLCKAQGDCGAYYNVLGRSTMDGYANTASEETKGSKNLYFNGYDLTRKDIGDWKILIASGGEALSLAGAEEPSFFSVEGVKGFVSKYGVPLAFFTMGGIWAKYAGGGSILAGATGGLKIIQAFFTKPSVGATATEVYGKTYTSGNLPVDASFSADTLSKTGYSEYTQYKDFVYQGNGQYSYYGTEPTYDVMGQFSAEQIPKGTEITGKGFESFTQNIDGTFSPKTGDIAVKGKGVQAEATTGGKVMGTVNTIMWLYTAYKLIDIIWADVKEQTYTISCAPWVAPDGGSDCEKCNEDPEKPCSLYRCKSLGQNCYLVNEGTEEEKCINLNPNDVNSPIIRPLEDVIPDEYTITETSIEGNKGYKVNERIGPYDSITLGIETDEPAQCKFIDEIGKDFDEMTTYFGSSQYVYEHETTFVIPAELTTQEAMRKTGDTYNLYIRCKDAAGNKNERDYFIRFTLEAEPDMTAPSIDKTSIENGAYMPSGVEETSFSIYVNERAECKYDTTDQDYSLMEEEFECKTSAFTTNSIFHGLYECTTALDFTNLTEYKWYIRCKDTSDNENKESYAFSLVGTEPLEITSIGPEGTFYESEVTLTATTSEGAENGKATCAYSDEDVGYSNMVIFLNTDATYHEQPLTPGTGEFTYYVKCLDIAGNTASANTTFTLDIDLEGPKILYIYVTPSNYLHIEMDEASTCEYSTETFTFGTGNSMTGSGTTVHELSITEKVYYVTCQDTYSNEASFIVYP